MSRLSPRPGQPNSTTEVFLDEVGRPTADSSAACVYLRTERNAFGYVKSTSYHVLRKRPPAASV